MNRILAIFPARGGSRRIPKKNILEFMGKPMLAHPLKAALSSRLFREVMVSTESREIASLAQSLGASVPFMRSEKTASDEATTDSVLFEVLQEYGKRGKEFDAFFCIYPTAVLLTEQMLKDAAALLEEHSSVMPVVRFSYPPQRGLLLQEGRLVYAQPEHIKTRSQDLAPIYHDAGLFYACRTPDFFRFQTTETPDTVPLILSELQVQDIDNPEDLEMARLKKLAAENKTM